MRLQLHTLTIRLETLDRQIRAHWTRLFEGWLDDGVDADLMLRLDAAMSLPPLPTSPLLFSDDTQLPAGRGIVNVYGSEQDSDYGDHGRVHLHFLDGALVEVTISRDAALTCAAGVVLPQLIDSGRFEDVVYTSLAPMLRRHQYFLVHAFAACNDDQAVLIVGPSHSGKTTAGLSLLLAGWRLISNDVVLLENRPDGIYCLPTPSDVGIRPLTFELLPGLDEFVGRPAGVGTAFNASAERLIEGNWAEPTRVTAVCLAQVEANEPTRITKSSRALCLARLMEESIDRWDTETLLDHMTILQTMCEQSQAFRLSLGKGVEATPELVQEALTAV